MILAEALIVGAAAFRVFQFFGRDSLTEPLRQRLERWPMVYRQLGNAIAVPVVEWIMRNIATA